MTVRGIEIRMTDELPQFIRDNQIQIAALTLPKAGAEAVAPILVENVCVQPGTLPTRILTFQRMW